MANVVETTGKTIKEAIQVAVARLGVSEKDIDVEVLETPTKKFFGLLGETPAKIRATLKISAPPVHIEEPKPIDEPAPIEETPAEKIVEPQPEPPVEKISEEPAEKFEPVLAPSPADEEPSEQQPLDREQILHAAENFLQDVFAAMELEVTIEVTVEEDGYLLDLKGKNLGLLIGRRGQALDALQYLLNLVVNRKLDEDKVHFTIDVEDYRRRREEALIKLAKGVAERAIKTRQDVRLEPMNRHERKIIHTVLQDNNRVETHSAGEEPYRYVIVSPVKRARGGRSR